jgi:hypothetical protein
MEKELFDRGLRTKRQIHKFWREDIEAIEYLKELLTNT